jgi:hypothetical protein
MATTTPNFGWAVPTSTDLVKDGAVAIETLGDSIDASLVDLKGGTTGQVLTKASGTDMDFSWTAVDPLVILDAKGDLITATAADTPARLAVGTNNQVLTADSSTATGLKWATPSSGGSTVKLTYVEPASNFTTTSTTKVDVTGYTITFTPTSATNKIQVIVSTYAVSGNTKEFEIALDGTNICNRDVSANEFSLSMNAYITNLSATSHTIKLRMNSVGGGTATVAGASSGYISNFAVMEIY